MFGPLTWGSCNETSNSNGYPDPSPFTPNNSTNDSAGISLAGRMDGFTLESMPAQPLCLQARQLHSLRSQ
ncbi:Hypothetical protein FKW44_007887 [Caligus rogercresseyi]|uniref:Uncharacterized protein n=1 Tax=Caligus rogercresseyi TaxID=217165 RepID=A0A7T8KFE4_CALRO|nr:Hypothetical protein FKW44_007887 [Caligus rogercresseyi]